MLSGDNGLLKRAGDARDDTVVGQEKESVELAYISAAVKKLGDDVTESELQIELNSSVGVNKTHVTPNRDGTLNVLFHDTEHNYKVDDGKVAKVDSADPIVIKTLAEQITATNYGDYINYNVDLNDDGDTTNDWKIFYKNDDGNVFIIAKDFLPSSKLPTSFDSITKEGTSDINSSIANKFMFTWSGESTESSAVFVAKLLDKNIWNNFASGITGAEAIGTPTLEMLLSSWNEKGYTETYYQSGDSGIYTTDYNGEYKWFGSYEGEIEFKDNLYFLKNDNGISYWLATFQDENQIYFIERNEFSSGSEIGLYADWNGHQCGLRPVICLPSTVTGEKNTNEVWTIE